jgi:hypothetical protein
VLPVRLELVDADVVVRVDVVDVEEVVRRVVEAEREGEQAVVALVVPDDAGEVGERIRPGILVLTSTQILPVRSITYRSAELRGAVRKVMLPKPLATGRRLYCGSTARAVPPSASPTSARAPARPA